MPVPKFDPSEMNIVKVIPASPFMPAINIYNRPVSDRESVRGLLKREAVCHISYMMETRLFCPRVVPDNVARSFVFEATPFDPNKGGGPDMFGMPWEYVPVAGGSMIRPGKPFIEDFNEWPSRIVWPDIEAWDWDSCVKENASI